MNDDFRHMLVPLDGSSLAEAVLPYVRLLGKTPGTRVSLVHLVERGAPTSVHGERHLRSVQDAEAYLAAVAVRLVADGLTVETHVDTNEAGDTAGRIGEHAVEWDVDLIVLCAHGRSGIGRWLFGSIAQKVLAAGVAPVLLVRPQPTGTHAPVALRTILVPLDSTPEAEVALPLAESIARTTGARMRLLTVVPTAETLSGAMSSIARFSPTMTNTLLDDTEQAAMRYLDERAQRLTTAGVRAAGIVARGNPADELVAAAKEVRADLLVMASHGRQGLAGVWTGSVGNKLLARIDSPFLLLRAPGVPRNIGD